MVLSRMLFHELYGVRSSAMKIKEEYQYPELCLGVQRANPRTFPGSSNVALLLYIKITKLSQIHIPFRYSFKIKRSTKGYSHRLISLFFRDSSYIVDNMEDDPIFSTRKKSDRPCRRQAPKKADVKPAEAGESTAEKAFKKDTKRRADAVEGLTDTWAN